MLEQSQGVLEREQSTHRTVQPLGGIPCLGHRSRHRVERRIGAAGCNSRWRSAREERTHPRPAPYVSATTEPMVSASVTTSRESRSESRRTPVSTSGATVPGPASTGIDGGERDVSRHHHLDAGGDRRAEGNQLDGVEPRPVRP